MATKFRAKNLSVKVGAQGGLRCKALTCQLNTKCHHTRIGCLLLTNCGFTSIPTGTTFHCLLDCGPGTIVSPQAFAEQLDELKAELQDAIKVVDAQKKLIGGPAKKRPRRRASKK